MTIELNDSTFDAFVEQNENVLIDCWAEGCGPCRMMVPVMDELSEELKGRVAVAKMKVDGSSEISLRFQITAVPMTLMIRKGALVKTQIGFRSKNELMAILGDIGMIQDSNDGSKHFATTLTDDMFDEFIKNGKYALIDCWATWCKPCLRMAPVVEKTAEISQGEISVGKLDVDSNPITSLRFGIQSIPTLLVYKDGKQVDVIVGFDPSLTAEKLKQHVLSM